MFEWLPIFNGSWQDARCKFERYVFVSVCMMFDEMLQKATEHIL